MRQLTEMRFVIAFVEDAMLKAARQAGVFGRLGRLSENRSMMLPDDLTARRGAEGGAQTGTTGGAA